MKILSRLLTEAASDVERFRFHPKCSKIKLTHLCFADDLLIFSGADMDSVLTIKEVLADFEDLSGLKANLMKSNFFFVLEFIEMIKLFFWMLCKCLRVLFLFGIWGFPSLPRGSRLWIVMNWWQRWLVGLIPG